MDKRKIKIINVVGARPNFMKMAPLHNLMLQNDNIEPILVHTGQHYDEKMSKIFFTDLGMPQPDEYLGIGSGSHAVQTAKIMVEFEKVIIKHEPDYLIVVGDVNSTVACSLVAAKMGVKIVHYEAGLRSFDREMPEEINRLVTDSITDLFYVSEESALENLKKEGHDDVKVTHVGNLMIDSLVNNIEKAKKSKFIKDNNLQEGKYVLSTLHRPSNVDDLKNVEKLVDILTEISKNLDIVFPIHPRTKNTFAKFEILNKLEDNPKIKLVDPIGYIDFLCAMQSCKLVLTDSGGIQEETTFLGKPCLTLRPNTERPSTILQGTNVLISQLDKQVIMEYVVDIIAGNFKKGTIPKYWDGHASQRIIEELIKNYQ